MRIGCLQFAPLVGDIDNNLNRADAVLSRANPDDLDLLVLPELAFSGYNFKSLRDITPFLEPSGSGITSLWARTVALKYNCTVTVGYPEKVDVTPRWPTGPEYYNSAIVVNGDGETISNYRKSFLYPTDETWALEGNRGFHDSYIPGLGNITIGICTDINPYKLEAPWNAFEFAFHILEMQSNLVIISMAWMTKDDPRRFTRMPNEPDMDTLTYWVTRLEPLIRSDSEDEIIVVFCNRTGNEDEALYAGTSAVIGIQDGEVNVYGLLGRGEKELLVIDTNNEPYAKLVYRPDARGTEAGFALSDTSPVDRKNNLFTPVEANIASQSSASQIPPPPQLPKDFAKDLPGERQALSVDIPSSLNPPKINSARSPVSPGTSSMNGSTRSTPVAVRPRIVIPSSHAQSPPLLPHRYPSDNPASAASENSIQSVKSNESEASVQTIRSNPRPPEESTPYPHSGAPPSGYPSNCFSGEKRILGGHHTVSTIEPFSPNTPFEDISPISSTPHYWLPSDSLLQTPGSAWTPGTPIGRRAEPFPWPAITGSARAPSRDRTKSRPKDVATPIDPQPMGVHSPQSNASSNRTSKSSKTTRSDSSAASKRSAREAAEKEKLARPSSPKSRNASRSRTHERSGSSLGDRDTKAVSQHLGMISLRAESASRTRSESANGTRAADRPQSSLSRNSNRTRPDESIDLQYDHHVIHVAASPSILDNGGQPSYQSLSRMARDQRSNSFVNSKSYAINNDTRGSDPGVNLGRPASRAASRGRTPGPKVPLSSNDPVHVVPLAVRSSSADSTRNDELHTRVRQPGSRASRASTSRTSATNGRRSRSDESASAEFERVEAILCPNCPVHGRHSSSSASVREETSVPPVRLPPTPSPAERPASSINVIRTPKPEQADPRRPSSGDASQLSSEPLQKPVNTTDTGILLHNDTSEASDCGSITATLATVSTPGTSPASPYFFYPPTPRAMVLKLDDTDVEPMLNGHLDEMGKTPTTHHTMADTVGSFTISTDPVA